MYLHICIDICVCVLCSINFLFYVYSNSRDIKNDLCDDQVEDTIYLKGHEISSDLFSVSPSLILPWVILSSCWENKRKQNINQTTGTLLYHLKVIKYHRYLDHLSSYCTGNLSGIFFLYISV